MGNVPYKGMKAPGGGYILLAAVLTTLLPQAVLGCTARRPSSHQPAGAPQGSLRAGPAFGGTGLPWRVARALVHKL